MERADGMVKSRVGENADGEMRDRYNLPREERRGEELSSGTAAACGVGFCLTYLYRPDGKAIL